MKKFKSLLLLAAIILISPSCGNDSDEETLEPPIKFSSDYSFTGTTETFPENNPSELFTTDRGVYNFTINKEAKSAEMIIEDAHFLNGMPALNPMTFPDLKLTTRDNKVILTSESLTPEINGRPFSGFPISNLKAEINPQNKRLVLTFTCGYRGTPYTVNVTGQQ